MEINWIGEALDTVVSLSGKWARWLNAKGRRVCFLIWAFGAIYWMVRDFYIGLYAQGAFCLISIWLNFYGFSQWKKKGIGDERVLQDK